MSEINAESTTMPPVELRMPRASEREEILAARRPATCARASTPRRVPIMPPVPRFSMSCCPATVPALT